MERCFLCHRKMDNKTGLCTNAKCIRSKPLTPKDETEEKKDAEELKQRMEAHKRKEEEEHALEMQRRNEASELLRHQRLAAQMMQPQPEKRKNLENENNNDCGPSI